MAWTHQHFFLGGGEDFCLWITDFLKKSLSPAAAQMVCLGDGDLEEQHGGVAAT